MADIVSLSKARKAKARAEKEALAAENRVKFGRTKSERLLDEKTSERARTLLDAKKRDDD